MRIRCQEYRTDMRLLGLTRRLEDKDLSPEEREQIRKEIKKLEKEAGID